MASRPSRRQDLTSVRSHDGFRVVIHTLMSGKKETEMERFESESLTKRFLRRRAADGLKEPY